MRALFDPIDRKSAVIFVVVAVALLALPLVVTNLYYLHVGTLALVFAVFASSWNLVLGFAGLKTLGQHAFFGIGAYTSALIAMRFGVSPWITIWVAGLVAAIFGLVVGLPILRIRSMPHVAIVTLGSAEIVRLVLSNLSDITRGEMGLGGIPAFDSIKLPFGGEIVFGPANVMPYYYLMLALFFVFHFLIYRLVRSRTGLALVAMRDSEDAAESLGLNLTFYKLLVFVVSAFVIGVIGGFYAHFVSVLTPSAAAGPSLLIMVVAMVLVGGLGTFTGPIIGAGLLVIGLETLRAIEDYRLLVYGGLIVTTMLLLPRGLVSLAEFGRSADAVSSLSPEPEPKDQDTRRF